jgi:hypothetical protein
MRLKLKKENILLHKSTSVDLLKQMRSAYKPKLNYDEAQKLLIDKNLILNKIMNEDGSAEFYLYHTVYDDASKTFISEELFHLHQENGLIGEIIA